jgi:hypothetical protein
MTPTLHPIPLHYHLTPTPIKSRKLVAVGSGEMDEEALEKLKREQKKKQKDKIKKEKKKEILSLLSSSVISFHYISPS